MANDLAISLLDAEIENTLRSAESYSNVEHAHTRGRLREIVIDQLLKPLLPPTWDVTTGIICCNDGTISDRAQSGQEDILIYDPNFLPPLLKKKEQAILPIESVIAVIEVKSKLTATDINQAVKHSAQIRKMPSTWQREPGTAKMIDQFAYPAYHIFSFESDLPGDKKTEWDRIVESHEKNSQIKPVINSVCSAQTCLAIHDYRITDKLKILGSVHKSTNTEFEKINKLLSDLTEKIPEAKELTEIQTGNLKQFGIAKLTRTWLLQVLDFTRAAHEIRLKKMKSPNLMTYFA